MHYVYSVTKCRLFILRPSKNPPTETLIRKNQSIFEKYFNLYDPDNIEHAQNEKDIQPLMVIYHIKDKIKK